MEDSVGKVLAGDELKAETGAKDFKPDPVSAAAMHGLEAVASEKLQTGAQTDVIFGQAAAADNRAGADTASSVMTANLTNSATPKVVEIATSAASRPRAITIR